MEEKFIKILNKKDCTGCRACEQICPVSAITMTEDDEGFLTPKINKDKCINCGLCKNVCPIIHEKNNSKNQHAYIFQNREENVRKESTSGGAFSAIAKKILDKNRNCIWCNFYR